MAGNADDLREALIKEAKRLIVDALYSGRGHQQAANRWATLNSWLGIPSTVASAFLASGAAIAALTGDQRWVTAALALLSAGFTALQAYLRPGEREDEHAAKGTEYITLRNQARLFLELDMRSDTSPENLASRLKELRGRYDALSQEAPRRIPDFAYRAVKKSIEAGESSYIDDPVWKELDN